MVMMLTTLRHVWNNVTLDQVMASTVIVTSACVVYNAHYEGSFPLTKHVTDHEAACRSGADEPQRLQLSPSQCRTLEQTGYLVVDDFLSRDEVRAAARAARLVQSRHSRGVDETVVFTGIRTSSLAYFEPSYVGATEGVPDCQDGSYQAEPALSHVRHLMRGLAYSVRTSSFQGFVDNKTTRGQREQQRADFGQPLSLGVPETLQLSLYKANHVVANYNAAHRDGSITNIWQTGILGHLRSQYLRQRYLTCILYLNDDADIDNDEEEHRPWDVSSDGGQLRIYNDDDNDDDGNTTNDASTKAPLIIVDDIAPRGGRLVLLSSQSVLHEVRPSQRDRIACSIWFTRN
jgi:2OG-Fe(II) oxygenase superfamily